MVTFNEVPQRFGHGPFYTRQEDLRREKWAKIAALTRIYLRQSEVIPFSHMDLARDAPDPTHAWRGGEGRQTSTSGAAYSVAGLTIARPDPGRL